MGSDGFLLNHLVLKSFYRPQWAARYASAAGRFWQALESGLPGQAGWFEAATIERIEGEKLLLDLSHGGARTMAEAAAFAKRPLVISHGANSPRRDRCRILVLSVR